MLLFFVLYAELSIMSGPAGETPAAFNLVRMVGAVVEMITDTIGSERAATALRHGEVVRLSRIQCCWQYRESISKSD